MIKKKIKPNSKELIIDIPEEWIGQELEIVISIVPKEAKLKITENWLEQFFTKPISPGSFSPLNRRDIYEYK